VALCCVGFYDRREFSVVGAVESAFTLYPDGVGVSASLYCFRAYVAVVVETKFSA